MNEHIKELLNDFSFGESASKNVLSDLSALKLPEDYLSIFAELNGGEGFVGAEYLILWKAEELAVFNKEYEVEMYAPGIFLFGSNGGGEGFGFDTRSKPFKVVQIPFIGMDLQYASPVADSFTHLLERMKESDGSLL
ncbi:SMI1/KNR4 family protein [Methylomonas methanica]|uniref:Cell wall assembly/cell proliferation coordinating protein, KNR4-like protein n=1 Tax=Methylomonas methanica (strain DSM 25384 / MC09) TaxID=857087 RepID=G0A3Y7_METMM|nr:SMI1/KNR4 family protein [Methylomonas methanica]AEG02759.1 Cell wall assembly/cell proliferation coordinating protein, KNR4-like protein [Methylomonas methanica MC09]